MTGSVTGPEFSATFELTRTGAELPEEDEDKKKGKARDVVDVDLDGFERRALLLPVGRGRFGNLVVNDKNQLIYTNSAYRVQGSRPKSSSLIWTMTKRRRRQSSPGLVRLESLQTERSCSSAPAIATLSSTAKAGQKLDKKVPLTGMSATIDPRAEWRQVFTDAWRIQRDYFYVANMHGVDWPAVREQYAKMLADCVSRDDVGFVIAEMIAELNIGHAYYMSEPTDVGPSVSVGMLGADFELHDGAYRIARIHSGGPWDLDARGPLSSRA